MHTVIYTVVMLLDYVWVTCVVLSVRISLFFLQVILGGGKPPAEQFNTRLYPAVVCTQRGGTMVK